LRDYHSCSAGSPGVLRITVEETRDVTMTDVAGHYYLPLARALPSATVAAVDPRGTFAPSLVPVRVSNNGDGVALPIVDAQTLANLALQNGQALDPQQGSLLAWVIDGSGAPVAGVTTTARDVLFEGNGPSELGPGSRTGAHGSLAIVQVAPTMLTLLLTPPPMLPLKADSYVLPIRPGAVTVSTLVLAPR
jgi:hypothetical protein